MPLIEEDSTLRIERARIEFKNLILNSSICKVDTYKEEKIDSADGSYL